MCVYLYRHTHTHGPACTHSQNIKLFIWVSNKNRSYARRRTTKNCINYSLYSLINKFGWTHDIYTYKFNIQDSCLSSCHPLPFYVSLSFLWRINSVGILTKCECACWLAAGWAWAVARPKCHARTKHQSTHNIHMEKSIRKIKKKSMNFQK